jgi:NADH-quinone oxidoreductase subunit N
MYLREPLHAAVSSRSIPTAIAVVVLAAFTLLFGIYPQPIVKAARAAAPVPAEASFAPKP